MYKKQRFFKNTYFSDMEDICQNVRFAEFQEFGFLAKMTKNGGPKNRPIFRGRKNGRKIRPPKIGRNFGAEKRPIFRTLEITCFSGQAS
jgi:hypothetical protein